MKNTAKLSEAMHELQNNTIGLFRSYGSRTLELVIEIDESKTLITTILLKPLGGYETISTPIQRGLLKMFPDGKTLTEMKEDVFAFDSFVKEIQFKTSEGK